MLYSLCSMQFCINKSNLVCAHLCPSFSGMHMGASPASEASDAGHDPGTFSDRPQMNTVKETPAKGDIQWMYKLLVFMWNLLRVLAKLLDNLLWFRYAVWWLAGRGRSPLPGLDWWGSAAANSESRRLLKADCLGAVEIVCGDSTCACGRVALALTGSLRSLLRIGCWLYLVDFFRACCE